MRVAPKTLAFYQWVASAPSTLIDIRANYFAGLVEVPCVHGSHTLQILKWLTNGKGFAND